MSPQSLRPPVTLDACSKCGAEVDPLRAARVRLISNRFFYFCSERCAQDFSEEDFRSSPPPVTPAQAVGSEAPAEPEGRQSPVPRSTAPSPHDVPTASESARATPTPQHDEARAERREATAVADLAGSPGPAQPSRDSTRPSAKPQVPAPGASQKNASTPPREAEGIGESSSLLGAAKPIRKVALERLSDEALIRTALFLGVVSLTLLLAIDSLWTLLLRLVIATVGATVLLVHALRPRSEAPSAEFGWLTAPLFLTIGFAFWAFVTQRDTAASSVTLVASMLLASSTNQWIQLRRDRRLVSRKRAIELELSRATTRLRGGQLVPVAPDRLRPGEEIIIHAGDIVPADVTVTSGRAEVNPWLGATIVRQVEPGESLYAGARLRSGQLRATVRWTGQDRHILRLLEDPARRVDWFAPLVLFARKLSQRGALVVVIATLLLGVLLGTEPSRVALWALALSSCLLLPTLHTLPANRAMLAVLDLLDRGVVIGNARVLEAMGKISTTVFCARGTLLLGEPELSHIEAFSNLRSDEILSLVAGAEQYGRHPVAVAVSRAARTRGIHPDAVRTPQALPGLGVTAVTSDGKQLVVGSRALMLKERISVARAEDKTAEIEASGRTVLLVAVAQRLVGLVALQDGLRPGARAAVQHLLDVGIEPVLLSGDARQTCEALGKAIDIEHLRPEVLPGERGIEIERLKSGGASVAVVGRSPADDIALSAASVSIALPSPGSRSTDYDVELASDEVQTAALALGRAHHYRLQTLRGTAAILAANAISGVLVLGLSLPAYVAPVFSIFGMLFADLLMFAENPPSRARSDRAHNPRKR